jgi:hypothetical protein
MAILVWFADRSTVPFLVAVLVVFYLPILLTTGYVRRKGVRLLPERRSAKYWLIAVFGGVPYLVFALGATAVYDPASRDDGSWWGALVGGVVGGAIGLLGLAYAERRRRRREDAVQDGE